MAYGYIDRDPFTEFKTTYQDPNRACLTQQEIDTIENKEIKIERLRVVRDIFLFMCYTGLSYADHPECSVKNTLLPIRSNQKLNSYLTEIGDICEIKKNLTCHIARHTFATTITLTNGVPIETVSKMLGHKNFRLPRFTPR